jgi:hypothetical protein
MLLASAEDLNRALWFALDQSRTIEHGELPARPADRFLMPFPSSTMSVQMATSSRIGSDERTFAWLNQFRRLRVRYEKSRHP